MKEWVWAVPIMFGPLMSQAVLVATTLMFGWRDHIGETVVPGSGTSTFTVPHLRIDIGLWRLSPMSSHGGGRHLCQTLRQDDLSLGLGPSPPDSGLLVGLRGRIWLHRRMGQMAKRTNLTLTLAQRRERSQIQTVPPLRCLSRLHRRNHQSGLVPCSRLGRRTHRHDSR